MQIVLAERSMVLLFDGVEEMNEWYTQIEDAMQSMGRGKLPLMEI